MTSLGQNRYITYYLDRSHLNGEFSFGGLVVTTSGSHSDEFGTELLEALHGRFGQFYDSGVELFVSDTKFDLFFAQSDLPEALKHEYGINQEIVVSLRNHMVVCSYC